MKHLLLFFFLLLLVAGGPILAQTQAVKTFQDPAQFIPQVKALTAPTRNENAIKVAAQLEQVWSTNALTSAQQTKVMDIAQKMQLKKMKARPYFENFFGALVSGINAQKLSGSKLDEFLNVTGESLEKDDVKGFENFLVTAYSFLNNKFIYKANYSKLLAQNGSFSFEYRPGAQLSQKEIQAALPEITPVTSVPVVNDLPPAPVQEATPSANFPISTSAEDDFWSKASKPKKAPVKKATTTKTPVKKETIIKKTEPAKLKPVEPEVAYTVPATGAVLVLQNVDLLFSTPHDSLLLKDVSGAVLLTRQTLVATKGRYEWSEGGNTASATFQGFHFDITKPGLKAEKVTLTHPAVLEKQVQGVWEYRSVKAAKGGDSGYPKFISYTNDARLKSIGQGITYVGGLTMAGKKIMTGALDKSLSNIIVEHEGKVRFKAAAASYALSDSLISAQIASVVLYRGKDSITHPAMRLKYVKPKHLLTLISEEGAFKKSLFFDSYHQMEISAEMLTWNITTPQINFSIINAKNQVPARFDSKEYFTLDRWLAIQGTADFHPLKVAVSFAARQKTNQFYTSDLARDVQMKEPIIRGAMSTLQKQGFINFNGATGLVTIKPKAWHYVSSSREKKDYDFITLSSLAPSGKNATIDLSKNELLVRGVEKFYFTGDSGAVYAKPDSNQVRILQNRDILFNGKVYASYFRFVGKQFTFNYKDFLVDMAKIDTIAFATRGKVKGMKGDEKVREQYLANHSNKSSGKLYLNRPDNKSGKKKTPGYPTFDALSPSYVYFDKPDILGGAYDTTVYFAIPPFKMDSLSSSKPNTIAFKGRFHSGGIFPDFNTTLGIMPDQSLGFEYQVPKDGFAAYGGKGKFYNKLTMSFKGLQGSGELKYLTTTLQSNAFTFYLDKTLTLGTKATVAEGNIGDAYFMQADFKQYALEWLPKRDTMNISTTTDAISMYENKFKYRGIVIVTPKGFAGDGELQSTDAIISSPVLNFSKTSFTGKNATFEAKSKTPNKPVVRATDVKLEFNLKDDIATFSPEKAGFASTAFPFAQFKTSLSGGKYDFKKKVVTLNQPKGAASDKAYFLSTNPDHGNLKFNASSGIYDIAKQTLEIGGVPYIASADAHIVPDSGQVFVNEKSDLRPFKQATVIDTVNKFHKLYQGEIDVISRTEYRGKALYDYENADNQTFKLQFGKFAMHNMKAEEVKPEVKPKKYSASELIAAADSIENPRKPVSVAKKGFLQKVGLGKTTKAAGAPVAAKPVQQDSLATDPIATDPIKEAEPIAKATSKKSRKKAKAEKQVQEAGSKAAADSITSNLLASAEPMRITGRKRRKAPTFDTSPYTSSVATIEEKDNFFIAPNVQFKGNATMNSNKEHLDFNGFIKLGFAKESGASEWMPYIASDVNPKEVKINIESSKGDEEGATITGLHISSTSGKLYPTFGSKKVDEADLDVFTIDGVLSFDKANHQYKLGKAKQANAEAYEGNLMTFNDATSEARYEGKVNLIQSTKTLGLTTSGNIKAKTNQNKYHFDAFMAFDVAMPESALAAMAIAITDNNGGAPEAVDAGSANLHYKLAEFIGNKGVQDYIAKTASGHVPLPAISTKLVHSLVFNNVQLHWSDTTQAWYSKGKLALSNILKKDINAQIPGYIEIKRGPESDIVTIYLEPIPSLWYYISYADDVITVASADDKVNGIIASKSSGSLAAGESMEKTEFVNYFRKNYLGLPPIAADEIAPGNAPADDFMEQGEAAPKKGRKDKKATADKQDESNTDIEAAPAEEKPVKKNTKEKEKVAPAKEESDLPGEAPQEKPKKKKKAKNEENDALPDIE
ncbi:hypothetical protein [Adhaeribacter radiodurans]|uniref:Translocation/assembly module TamB domain-containing protein n=1 Tax=Adhaeribacter radiodurans TaxID=2745197 RepID=A0A7L7LDG7_9BACT|nr:hypothetical protein [Adhaeribacter radiodurans]QMU30797.1 hypothetical protein HUW48_23420 [Adhaeribacter radiodurans]